MPTRSPHELLTKMRRAIDSAENVLRDSTLSSEVQISDVGTICWGMVELCFLLQKTVDNDLSNLD